MNKKIKLAAALGSLTTASIAITAFTLPQFNSLESYMFKPNNWYTDNIFTKQGAIDYLNNTAVNELFSESIASTRVVDEVLIEATLSGIQSDYFDGMSPKSSEVFDDVDNAVAEQTAKLKAEFTASLASHLITEITRSSNRTDVFVPSANFSSGSSFVSSEFASELQSYFRGAGGVAFTSINEAFASLIDQSQIQFMYNGTPFDTIDAVIAQWMTDEGYANDSDYKEVFNHLRWEATHSYNASNNVPHSFSYIDTNPNTTESSFKAAAQQAFYNEMVQFETFTKKTYTESEWEVTSDYTTSRDAWLADSANNNYAPPALNVNLIENSMISAFGAYDPSTKSIDGPGDEFFPSVNDGSFSWWYNAGVNAHQFLPNLQDTLNANNNESLAQLSFLALISPTWNGKNLTSSPDYISYHVKNGMADMCADGESQTDSTEWKSWEAYSKFMGFDKIDIPVEDRPDAIVGKTINDWYLPDCEGTWSDRGLSGSQHSSYHENGRIEWFNDTFLTYFGYKLNTNGTWPIDSFLKGTTVSQGLFLRTTTNFRFTDKTAGGALTGLTLLEGMFKDLSVSATEQDYIDSATGYTVDYRDWVSKQDHVFIWHGNEYKNQVEWIAKDEMDDAIKAFIELQAAAIVAVDISETKYEVTNSAGVLALDPGFKLTDYPSIDAARNAVKDLIEMKGYQNVWTEVGTVTMIWDDYYKFDTTEVYYSIEEALDGSNWNVVNKEVLSAIGKTDMFEDLVQYNSNKVMMLTGYNGTTTDIMFDMSINELANKLSQGYDLSHIDSNITKFEVNITDPVKQREREYVTYQISLAIDIINSDLTKFITTEEFVRNSDESDEALNKARTELIDYWKNYINV